MKLFLLLALSLAAHAETPKVVGLLCYPSDELIEGSCAKFQEQMAACGYTVVRVNDFSGDFAKTSEEDAKKIRSIPVSAPVFISSHGNSYGKKHYLDSNAGTIQKNKLGNPDEWTVDPSIELLQVEIPDEEKLFATDPILNAVGEHPIVLSSCFSGRACEIAKPKLNLIASCSPTETSKNVTVAKGVYQEPVLYWTGQLYCDPKLFESADTDEPKGALSQKEVMRFLVQKMGGKKTVHTVIYPAKADGPNAANSRVLDEAVAEKEGKRILEEALATRPGFKGTVRKVGEQFRLTFANGSPPHTLPGEYSSSRWAEIAAEKWAAKQNPKRTGYKIERLGPVREVVLEDTNQACALTGLGTTQTPIIRGTIQSRPTHK